MQVSGVCEGRGVPLVAVPLAEAITLSGVGVL